MGWVNGTRGTIEVTAGDAPVCAMQECDVRACVCFGVVQTDALLVTYTGESSRGPCCLYQQRLLVLRGFLFFATCSRRAQDVKADGYNRLI